VASKPAFYSAVLCYKFPMDRFLHSVARCMTPALFAAALVLGMSTAIRAEPPSAEPPPPGEQSTHFEAKVRAGKRDLADALHADGHFETLLKAVEAAGLTQLMHSRGPFTVFAPTDDAFGKLPAGTLDRWLKDTRGLKQRLRLHILKAYVPTKQVMRLRNALTTSGGLVRFEVTADSAIKVNGAKVIKPDIQAANGVLHGIDAVLEMPERPSGKAGKKKAAPEDEGAERGGNDS